MLYLYCLLYIIFVFIPLISSREPDDRQFYLYDDSEDTSLIIHEYKIHNLALHYQDTDYDEKGGKLSIENTIRPSFVLSNYPKNRVIEWYSPWCGHCQRFKEKYIEVASEIYHLSSLVGEIEFYAISCSAHHRLCQENNIRGYPTVRSYKAYNHDFVELTHVTTDTILHSLNINSQSIEDGNEEKMKEISSSLLYEHEAGAAAIMNAAYDSYSRTTHDVLNDAALSFLYALKTDMFSSSGDIRILGSKERQDAFLQWVDLLYWTLPSSWKLNTIINDIRVNYDIATISSYDLSNIVNLHHKVVLEKVTTWSQSCSHGTDGHGYTCGLWNLFHIVTVGVAERHKTVLGDKERISTLHALNTIRNYIIHFLGCEECREIFDSIYTEYCGRGICDRFISKRKVETNGFWQDLAIFIWEIHNELNIRVLRNVMANEGNVASNEDEDRVIWPCRQACPSCRDGYGNWNIDQVYSYLKAQYWPAGVHNFRYVMLDKLDNSLPPRKNAFGWASVLNSIVLLAMIVFIVIYRSYTSRLIDYGDINKGKYQ